MLIKVSDFLSFFMSIAAGLVLLLASVLLAEVLASYLPAPATRNICSEAIRTAILMPAHNEALIIEETLRRLKPQLQSDDRLIVIADNCDDQTRQIAEKARAEVIYRNEPALLGKGVRPRFRHPSSRCRTA